MFNATSYEISGFCTKSDLIFFQKFYETNIGAALGRCIENDPAVHISNSNGPFLQTMASDFAVKRTAANFKTPGSLMFVPV